MKTWMLLILTCPQLVLAALIDPALREYYDQNTTQKVAILALMEYPQIQSPAPIGQGSGAVRSYLASLSRRAWLGVWPNIQNEMDLQHIQKLTVHPINNSLTAVVDRKGLYKLATTAGITKIYLDRGTSKVQPVAKRPVRFIDQAAYPYDLRIMKLDQVWAQRPDLNGTGVLVGHIDTGVDGKHPALAGRIAKFYHAGSGTVMDPFDEDSHGTHTAGTIVGIGKNGAPMGVSPGAKLVSAAGLSGYDDILKSMEFMMDPDGNPATADAPRLVSNSWNCEGAPDLEAFYRAINAWEAAGILTIFSAGNAGPSARSITKPHEHPLAFAVGAHDERGMIARFSSRGPGVFNGTETKKPDVAAPGVSIVSSVPGGGYSAYDGTSMATPHVAGLAALVYQLNPNLKPDQVRQVLLASLDSVDMGGQPQSQVLWNASYGYGRVNALKMLSAVQNISILGKTLWAKLVSPTGFIDNMFGLGSEKKSNQVGIREFMRFETDKTKWSSLQ